jgi:hypothetical protein
MIIVRPGDFVNQPLKSDIDHPVYNLFSGSKVDVFRAKSLPEKIVITYQQ